MMAVGTISDILQDKSSCRKVFFLHRNVNSPTFAGWCQLILRVVSLLGNLVVTHFENFQESTAEVESNFHLGGPIKATFLRLAGDVISLANAGEVFKAVSDVPDRKKISVDTFCDGGVSSAGRHHETTGAMDFHLLIVRQKDDARAVLRIDERRRSGLDYQRLGIPQISINVYRTTLKHQSNFVCFYCLST